jgi:hypothetical protein
MQENEDMDFGSSGYPHPLAANMQHLSAQK